MSKLRKRFFWIKDSFKVLFQVDYADNNVIFHVFMKDHRIVRVQELTLTEIGDTIGTMVAHLIMGVLTLIMVLRHFLKLKTGIK